MKVSDSILTLINFFKKHIGLLESSLERSRLFLQLDWKNFSITWKQFFDIFLCNLYGNVFYKKIWIEIPRHVLVDHWLGLVWSQLIVTLRDVMTYKDKTSVVSLLPIKLFDSLQCWFGVLETHETTVWKSISAITLENMCWNYLTKPFKHTFKTVLVSIVRNSLNKHVVSDFILIGNLLLSSFLFSWALFMSENFKFLSIKFTAICSFKSFFGILFFLELYKAVSATSTIVITLELAFDDWTKTREKLVNLLLSGFDS